MDSGSLAEQLGILPGDELVQINGREVRDLIDYQAFCADTSLTILVSREDDETEYAFEKDEYEPLGLTFEKPLMSEMRSCANNCVFCFENQNPKGARETLGSRDDDWRLSLMTGSYVTLTNVGDRELRRIVERHASPLYISVHATDGKLREELMGNPRAGKILSQLTALKNGGISFHTQAVLCPGINDGQALEKTIHDLAALYPAALSLAVVPAGLTWHREGVPAVRAFTKEQARDVLAVCAKWRAICEKQFGEPFVYPADELYLLAGLAIPEDGEYGDYGQLENGVGMLRSLKEEYDRSYDSALLEGRFSKTGAKPRKAVIATGAAAAGFLRDMLRERPVPGADVRVHACSNFFFGDSVTVAGLLTGRDLIHPENELFALKADAILITELMLREGDRVFLDGMTVDQVSARLQKPIRIVSRGGEALLEAIETLSRNG